MSFSLQAGPANLTVDSSTGALSWSPAAVDKGSHSVVLRVEDGRGGWSEQQYVLSVIDAPPNRPPYFTSVPVVDASVSQPYFYDADAVDPDSDALTYTLLVHPQGMSIDEATGILTWSPTSSQVGTHNVTISVSDGLGGSAMQSFLLQVNPDPRNHPPVIVSEPVTSVSVDHNPQNQSQFRSGELFISSSVTDEIRVYDGETLQFIRSFTHPLFSEIQSTEYSYRYGPNGAAFNDRGNLVVAAYSHFVEFSDYGVEYARYDKATIEANENVIFDPLGNLYTTTSTGGSNQLNQYRASDYRFQQAIDLPSGAGEITGITFDSRGRLYVASQSDAMIYVLQADPTFSSFTFAKQFSAPHPPGFSVEGIQFNQNGELIAAGGDLVRYNVDSGEAIGSFDAPNDLLPVPVTVDNRGRIYVADFETGDGTGSADIFRFPPDGSTFITVHDPVLKGPFGLAISGVILPGGPPIPYSYDVDALDPDNDTFTYALENSPLGMTIDSSSGVISWGITPADFGDHGVTVRVDDGRGGFDEQSFTIEVRHNRPPEIVSEPVTTVFFGHEYAYDVDAIDPDDDTVAYSLVQNPDGMTIDSATGLIDWAHPIVNAEVDFNAMFGNHPNTFVSGVTFDTVGNLYAVGYFRETVDFDPGLGTSALDSRGESDGFIVKFDADNALVWARGVGGESNDGSNDVEVDEEGNVYVCGGFAGNTFDADPGPADYYLTAEGNSWNGFALKLDSQGQFIWAGNTNRGPGAGPYSVDLDGLGNVYLAGAFTTTADFDPSPGEYYLTQQGAPGIAGVRANGFVQKLDNDGNFVWARAVHGSRINVLEPLAVDDAGRVYVGGRFEGTADFDPGPGVFELTSAGASDLVVMKLDADGNFIWAKNMGGPGSEGDTWGSQPTSHGIAIDGDGNVHFTGEFSGAADFDSGPDEYHLVSNGGKDVCVVKLASDGKLIWARGLGGGGLDAVGDVTVDTAGNVYTTGTFADAADFDPGPKSFELSGPSGFISILDPNGDFVWAGPIGGTGSVAVHENEGIAHAGGRYLEKFHLVDDQFPVTVRVGDGHGGYDEQSFTIEVVDPRNVDLAVSEVEQHALVFDGQQLTVSGTISATIGNLGSHSVPGPFDVVFFEDRNDNSSYDSGVDNALGMATVAAPLAAGATATVTASLDGPILFSGNRIWAYADSGLAIPEANEDNNFGVRSCRIGCESGQCQPAPDLTASYVRASQVGQDFTYTARIGNGGSVLAPAGVNVAFYDGDPRQGGVFRGVAQTTKESKPGQYEDVSLSASGPFFADVWVVADDVGGPYSMRAEGYQFSTIDVPGATKAGAYGVNSAGQVVGYANYVNPVEQKGFLLDNGVFSTFAVPGSVGTEPMDLNDNGQIVGAWVGFGYYGFLTTTDDVETFITIDVPGAGHGTVAMGIDDAGEIVGYYADNAHLRHGFLRSAGGSYTTIDYPGATHTWAYGNNDFGQIVGEWRNDNTGNILGSHAWLRDASGQFTTVDVPLATGTVAIDINDAGQVVGYFQDSSGRQHGFLRDAAGLFTVLDVPSAVLTHPRGNSDDGKIAGYWQDSAGDKHGFVATPVGQVRECDEENNFYQVMIPGAGAIHGTKFNDLDGDGFGREFAEPTLADDFNRADGVVGNGWLYASGNNGGDLVIRGEELVSTAGGWGMYAGIHRPIPLDQLTTVQATVKETLDSGGARSRFESLFAFRSDGQLGYDPYGPFSGYGVKVQRTSSNWNNSAVSVYDGDTLVARILSSFQFDSVLIVDFTIDTDGSISGSISEGANVFRFEFGPHLIHSSGTSFMYAQSGRGVSSPTSPDPRMDDLRISTREPGLADWLIYLDQNANGTRDSDERWTRTDVLGDYSFTNLPSGRYYVAEEQEAGWTQTVPSAGRYDVALSSGDVVTGIDFGNREVTEPQENRPPAFASQPPANATSGSLFRYNASATDPDSDQLTFDLVVKPTGMAVALASGVVVWVPTADQVGAHDVTLRVQDGRGGVALQSFRITVSKLNSTPVITSIPKGPAVVGLPWQYQVAAQDADGDTITLQLDAKPDGMQIDPNSGLVTWTPTSGQVGSQHVEIAASDGRGGITTQSFDLPVVATAPNDSPRITSIPRGTVRLGATYLYQVLASDPNGDPLTYSLTTKPDGMVMDTTGLVTWTPTGDQLGDHTVVVRVEDGRGGWATQGFVVTVATQDSNRPPSIVSTPGGAATVSRQYAYDVRATDPDGDPVVFGLDRSPTGMSMDPNLGTIRWTPTTDQLGNQEIVVRVTDARGAWATQSYTLVVRSVNLPPNITSAPPTTAAAGEAYSYAVRATDPDGDALSFSLTQQPTGMTIDSATGVVQWTPDATQLGSQDVVIRVEDGQGGYATQTYTIVVSATPTNEPPIITSTPSLVAVVEQPYQYAVTAIDPEGDTLLYSLLVSPDGLTVDPVTGLVQWTPSSSQLGEQAVTVAAIDPAGAGGTQSFTIAVADNNQAPQITSSPVQVVTAGLPYRYDVRATDPDGDPVQFSIAGPSGMTIDAFGRVTWSPQITNIGTHRIEVTATDDHGAWIRQDYDLVVLADGQTPRVNLFVSDNPVEINSLVTLAVSATDNVRVAAIGLTINGTPVVLDAQGRITFVANPVGQYTVVASASDAAGNTGLASTVLTVRDTSDVDAPVVEVTSPVDGAVITSPVEVIGTVEDANLLYYTLSAARTDSGVFTELFRGTSEVSNGVLGTFDPSGLANDAYVLRLEAVDAGGNVSFIDTLVNVAGDLKLGNFTLSFTDLSIPVSGIPITVTRTYDSLTADQQDDLGYGWGLEFRDTNLRTNVEPTGMEEYGFYTPFSTQTQVYVTLPGGRRERFTFDPAPMSGFGGVFFYQPAFDAQAGSTSTLSVAITNSTVLLPPEDGNFYNAAGLPYNPSDKDNFGGVYYLTTKDGIRYEIDANSGDMTRITDPNQNTLTFSDTSIDSSTGKRITFERDPQNRIKAVVDPTGAKIAYEYAANGDLVAVTDREGNRTQLAYEAPRAHYLTEVIDPLGRTGVRSEYDAQGRLVKLIDAAGKPVELIHNPNNSLETVKDALGNPTTFEYDERGNVVTEVNALGGTTYRTYDAASNMLSETDPLGRVTAYTYDGSGNVLTETDPLGHVTRYTYGSYGRLLTSTDPLGNTTTNTYDGAGNLLTTTDASGNVTRYAYDSRGNQTSITDAVSNVTSFEYDGAGNMTQQVDALGIVTTYTYDGNGNQLSQTTTVTTPAGPRTLVTTTQYDSNGRPVTVTDAEGHSTVTEYDALGNQAATVDAFGRRTEFNYDERGQLITTVFADGSSTSSTYDDAGRRITSTDRAGHVTGFVYDALGRLTATAYPDDTPADASDNPRTTTEYDEAGQVVAQIDELGNRTEFEYDLAGRQCLVRNALSDEIVTTYDAAGRRTATTDALGRITQFVFDTLGRQTETRFTDGTSTQTEYDALGRSVVQTDQAGRVTHFEYDALGRLTAVVDALNQRTEYGYDEAGNLVTQQDANGHITRYEYDGLGRRIATVLPLGERSTTAYDDVSNVASTTDFNGDTTTFQYDTNNRLLAKDFADDTSVSFTYTATGQRQSYTDARGTTTYAYDVRDRLTSRTDPDGTSIAYAYDAASNRTSVTSPAGTIAYSFDALNRLATVADPEDGVTSYTYDVVGALVQTQFPNGTQETREYDSLNRLLFLENEGPSGVISSYRYTLDPTGNRTRVVEHDGRTVDYAYDEIYRLIGESITDSTAGNRNITYTYDPVGNRLTRDDSTEGVTAYTYDDNDRLLTEVAGGVTTTYGYDDNGNTLSRASATDQVFYDWDFENRLISADTDGDGTNDVAYQYDADGIRVSSESSGEQTCYLIDTSHPFAQVVAEYTPAGVIKVSYVHGLDLISQNRPADTGKSFYHVDGLGSTRAVTNASGLVTDTYIYDAFGRTIGQVGSTVNVYLFAGEQRDAATGLDYLRARWMSPSVGRFYGMDPFAGVLSTPATLHRFLYAAANPSNFSDPSGLLFGLTRLDLDGPLALQRLDPARQFARNTGSTFVFEAEKGFVIESTALQIGTDIAQKLAEEQPTTPMEFATIATKVVGKKLFVPYLRENLFDPLNKPTQFSLIGIGALGAFAFGKRITFDLKVNGVHFEGDIQAAQDGVEAFYKAPTFNFKVKVPFSLLSRIDDD